MCDSRPKNQPNAASHKRNEEAEGDAAEARPPSTTSDPDRIDGLQIDPNCNAISGSDVSNKDATSEVSTSTSTSTSSGSSISVNAGTPAAITNMFNAKTITSSSTATASITNTSDSTQPPLSGIDTNVSTRTQLSVSTADIYTGSGTEFFLSSGDSTLSAKTNALSWTSADFNTNTAFPSSADTNLSASTDFLLSNPDIDDGFGTGLPSPGVAFTGAGTHLPWADADTNTCDSTEFGMPGAEAHIGVNTELALSDADVRFSTELPSPSRDFNIGSSTEFSLSKADTGASASTRLPVSRANTPSGATTQLPSFFGDKSGPSCFLCPAKYGALLRCKPTEEAESDASAAQWAHVSCAVWTPGVRVVPGQHPGGRRQVEVTDASKLDDQLGKGICCLCPGLGAEGAGNWDVCTGA